MPGIFSKLKDKITQFADVRLRLVKLQFIERTSELLSYLVFVIILLFITSAVLLFIGFGIAEWLSAVFDSRIAGYFGAAGIYLILSLLVLLVHKPVVHLFSELFIRLLTSKGDDDDEEEEDVSPVP